jgi:PAS domain S-box-containing protein
MSQYVILSVLLAAFIFVATIVVLRRAQTRRRAIAEMAEAVKSIGLGEYCAALDINCKGELAGLGNALKDCAAKRKENTIAMQYIGSVIDAMDASIIVVAPDGLIKTINRATTTLLGYRAEELVGQPFRVLVSRHVTDALESEDIKYLRKDGKSIDVHFSSSELGADSSVSSRAALGMVCVARDISAQNAVRDALKASEGKLHAILQAIGDLIIMVDKDMRILWANEAVTRAFGYDITGKKCHEVLFNQTDTCVQDEQCAALRTFNDQLAHSFEINVNVFGSSKVFECTTNVAMRDGGGAPIAVIEVCRDVTEHRRTEQALIQNAKLASLGELGAGIAHELNSPLAGILSLAEVMLKRMDDGDANYKFVEKIKDASVRSKHIIMDLMSYSLPDAQTWRPLSINHALRSVLSLFISELKTFDVRIEQELAPDLPDIIGSKGQLMEVFLNIIKNARDAIDGAGLITIKTYSFKEDGVGFVKVEFIDNGLGMTSEVIQRIFDPFYTTKEKGGGMNIGLGLSISKGIVEAHCGRLEVESFAKGGACFRVIFPAIVEQEKAHAPAAAKGE